VKKTSMREYSRPRSNGVNAITVRDGDELVTASLTNGVSEIILGSKKGYAVRFSEENVRAIGRTGAGVRGITLRGDDDELIGMVCVDTKAEIKEDIMVVSENGYGKRSALEDYRITSRGGKGVISLNVTDKTGNMISIQSVTDENDLMIINKSGLTIRIGLNTLRTLGRNTQGVSLIKLKDKDAIAAVSKINHEEEEELEEGQSNIEENENDNSNGQIEDATSNEDSSN
jgi:DNA gyrase subunit A